MQEAIEAIRINQAFLGTTRSRGNLFAGYRALRRSPGVWVTFPILMFLRARCAGWPTLPAPKRSPPGVTEAERQILGPTAVKALVTLE